ncbi:MAG: ankyrin repeat domain-containing protein [Cyanobacteria bacterium J06636_16]
MFERERLNLRLHDKVNNGDCISVVELLDQGADINDRDVAGDTPLMEAVCIGAPELVELLIRRGADLNAISSQGKTILDLALDSARKMKHSVGHQEVVLILRKVSS